MTVEGLIGQELVSPWLAIEQPRIDEFAHATDDPQWIHTDPERAAAGPFGTTIAHGFLTLSLVVPIEAVEDVTGGKQARVAATIEREGQEKPACVAEALFRFLR